MHLQALMAAVSYGSSEYRGQFPFGAGDSIDEGLGSTESRRAIELGSVNRAGLRDLRPRSRGAPHQIFRKYPDDPRRFPPPLSLWCTRCAQHSLEAESCYRDVADWQVARGQFLSDSACGKYWNFCSRARALRRGLEQPREKSER